MGDTDSVSTALKNRRSIRDFADIPVDPGLLDLILTDALNAPSWGNIQPYRVAVAMGPLKDAISADLMDLFNRAMAFKAASPFGKLKMLLSGAPKPDGDYNTSMTYTEELGARYRDTGLGLYRTIGIEKNDKAGRMLQMGKNFSFFGAPCVLFVFCADSLGPYGPLDTGAFIQSLALAAHERGLGTCMQAALATWAGPVRSRFEVPAGYNLICGISLGYASGAPVNAFAPVRRPLNELKLTAKP